MIASNFELAAMKGLPLPQNATKDEIIEYLFFKALYAENKNGSLDRKTCSDLKLQFLFLRKCWNSAGERYNKTNYAIYRYMQDKSIVNADKIVETFSGLKEIEQ